MSFSVFQSAMVLTQPSLSRATPWPMTPSFSQRKLPRTSSLKQATPIEAFGFISRRIFLAMLPPGRMNVPLYPRVFVWWIMFFRLHFPHSLHSYPYSPNSAGHSLERRHWGSSSILSL